MPHCFEPELAVKYGVLEAILLTYFGYWIQKNEANEDHFHDGRYWTYNSIRAFTELFPYASYKMIRTALDHLKEEGLIITGNYNKLPFDQTRWYTLTDKGLMEVSYRAQQACPTGHSRSAPQGEPIPINNTINKPLNNNNAQITEEFNELWELYPNKKGRRDALRHYRNAREEGVTFEEVKQGIEAYSKYIKDTKSEKFTKYGSSFFCQRSWQDDWSVDDAQYRKNHKEEKTWEGWDDF